MVGESSHYAEPCLLVRFKGVTCHCRLRDLALNDPKTLRLKDGKHRPGLQKEMKDPANTESEITRAQEPMVVSHQVSPDCGCPQRTYGRKYGVSQRLSRLHRASVRRMRGVADLDKS